jgi:hypothetical protein
MPAYEYAFTVTPGRSSRARSLTIAGAAIAAVCVLSSTVVMRELVGTPTARAAIAPATTPTASPVPTTTPAATVAPARTWALEPRWWRGEIRQIVRSAPTVQESELTFTKGYQLRLAARQVGQPVAQPATPPAQVATTTPAADPKAARTAATVRKATTVAHTDTPEIRPAARIEGPGNPFARFDVGTRALAYDSQRSSERGVADVRRTPPKGLFGTLY